MKLLKYLFIAVAVIFSPAQAVFATTDTVPLNMRELRATTPQIDKEESFGIDGAVNEGISLDIRKEAQEEAAMSYGARGGLSFRSYEIKESLDGYGFALSRVFDFRRLLIRAPSGLLIEPPIISEAQNTLVIQQGGIEAAVSDRTYNIIKEAKIVTAPRDWHQYLQPALSFDIQLPPKILWPVNLEEKNAWDEAFEKGWNAGIIQADQTFESNLELLNADFNGMIRYRTLLAQNMVSEPYALYEDRGITGGGDEMRVGDRAVRITGPSQFRTGFEEWQPADR